MTWKIERKVSMQCVQNMQVGAAYDHMSSPKYNRLVATLIMFNPCQISSMELAWVMLTFYSKKSMANYSISCNFRYEVNNLVLWKVLVGSH